MDLLLQWMELYLDPEDLILSEAQIRVRGKGNKVRLLPLAPEAVQLLEHYLRLERPPHCGTDPGDCLQLSPPKDLDTQPNR